MQESQEVFITEYWSYLLLYASERSILMQNRSLFSLAALGFLTLAASAHAEKIYGITGASFGVNLVSFDSATPNAVTTIAPLTGVVGNQLVRGIDFRPANGKLYAVSNLGTAAQLYTVNLTTGALTTVGSGFTFTSNPGTRISLDFNPTVDRLRVVSGNTNNLRVNPNTGALVATDTNLAYDASTGLTGNPLIADIAYSNNVVGATQTTLYSYDFINDVILTVGSPNGTPNSPNGGKLFDSLSTPGSGIFSFNAGVGFDISGTTGVGYISAEDLFDPSIFDLFYTVNFTDGTLTKVGDTGLDLLDISVFAPTPVPEPGTIALLVGLGMTGVALRRRRK